jgi:hypothetical protein
MSLMSGGAERLVQAAITRLSRGDGKGGLRDLGVDRTEVIRDARVGNGVIYNHFDRGQGVVRGLVDEVMAQLLREQQRLAENATAFCRSQAEALADGAGRPTIARAILEQQKLYGAVPDADDLTRARERAYYLAVALCDTATNDSDEPISAENDRVRDDVRFRRHLLEGRSGHRSPLIDVYQSLLASTNREPIHDLERLELVIRTLFEGAMLLQRVATGHGRPTRNDPANQAKALQDDALVDATLRVFIAMSRPANGVGSDPDLVLFSDERATTPHSTCEPVLYRDREGMLAAVIEAIDQLSSAETLTLCALHRSEVGRSRSDDRQAVKPAVMRFLVDRGGQVRTLEKISSVDELEEKVETLRVLVDAKFRITARVLVMDSPPGLSPLLVGDRVAFLGREVDGLIVDAVAFFDDLGRRWCEAHCDTLWRDDRGYTLATPNGFNRSGIDNARRKLKALDDPAAA